MAFMIGVAFAVNFQGLYEDIVGRDHVLSYVNNPANWTDSRVSAPIHVVVLLGCALALFWKRS